MYPPPIQQLINAFSKLPSVGTRTAERFVFHLLRSGKKDAAELTNSLKYLLENIKSCEICWDFSDKSPCAVCTDHRRDKSTICIVAHPQDLQSIEKTGAYTGRYHVLRGELRAEDENSLKYTKIKELLKRASEEDVKEIIFALNPDLPGETTMMYLEKQLREVKPDVKLTRLARGLPMGSDLEYADEITLGSALKNRTEA